MGRLIKLFMIYPVVLSFYLSCIIYSQALSREQVVKTKTEQFVMK
ncbi:hypothetical protein J537_1276 [Acinetobacter baumannii 1437282]|nr:hypothetical protein J537_1276 [Acinetobacter baumannii 1437282]